jgi:hypothetical protein
MAAAGSGLLAGAGAGAGRRVLFLHGYAQDAAVFRGRAGRWRPAAARRAGRINLACSDHRARPLLRGLARTHHTALQHKVYAYTFPTYQYVLMCMRGDFLARPRLGARAETRPRAASTFAAAPPGGVIEARCSGTQCAPPARRQLSSRPAAQLSSSCPAVQLSSSGARWCLMLGRGWASLRKTLNFLKAEYEFAGGRRTSLCTKFTTHPLHARFANISGASLSEAITRPNPAP